MNTVDCVVEDASPMPTVRPLLGHPVKVEADIPVSAKGKKGTFGVRPEDLEITTGNDAFFHGTVDIVEQLGEVTLLYVNCGDPEAPIVVKLDGIHPIARGEKVGLTAPTNLLHVFDENGRAFRRNGG